MGEPLQRTGKGRDPGDGEHTVCSTARVGERVGERFALTPDQVDAQHDRVVLAALRGIEHAARHHLRIEDDVRRHVDRVVERRVCGQPRLQCAHEARRRWRHLEAQAHCGVGHHDAGAAGVAQHRYVARIRQVRGARICDEHLQMIDQRLDAVGAHDAVSRENRPIDVVRTGKRAGM